MAKIPDYVKDLHFLHPLARRKKLWWHLVKSFQELSQKASAYLNYCRFTLVFIPWLYLYVFDCDCICGCIFSVFDSLANANLRRFGIPICTTYHNYWLFLQLVFVPPVVFVIVQVFVIVWMFVTVCVFVFVGDHWLTDCLCNWLLMCPPAAGWASHLLIQGGESLISTFLHIWSPPDKSTWCQAWTSMQPQHCMLFGSVAHLNHTLVWAQQFTVNSINCN